MLKKTISICLGLALLAAAGLPPGPRTPRASSS